MRITRRERWGASHAGARQAAIDLRFAPSASATTIAACLALAVAPAGCMGPSGPQLPPNVGANHSDSNGGEAEEQAEPAPPPEPVEVGTLVWANFHDTGFYFHGVVVDRREDMHRVIYADGASEWLPSAALLPDALAEDAQVHVRGGVGDEFQAATVGRRLGHAIYLRLPSGDERWNALPNLRFSADDGHVPARGAAALEPSDATAGEVGSRVLVDYRGQGMLFAAVVTARSEDGRLHVVYLDGESEWVPPSAVGPDDVAEGRIVHVRRSWEPPVWVRGRVQQRIRHALRVQFEDGGLAWTAMVRVRVPSQRLLEANGAAAEGQPERPEVTEQPEAPEEAEERPRRRRR